MSESLVPYGSSSLSRRHTSRGLAQITSEQMLAEIREDALARIAAVRIRNGSILIESVVLSVAAVDGLITEVSHDRPGLEMTLRPIHQAFAKMTASIALEYLQR